MFIVPPSSVEAAELPPAIRTSDAGSFARYTFMDRVPGILRETLALNDFPEVSQRALEALHVEVTQGRVRELREDAPDRTFWNTVSASHIGRSWLDVPWYWAEAFFYRRLLEATGYFQPGPGHQVDPFGPKKATELALDAAPHAVNALLSRLPDEPRGRFDMLLHASLWGNRSDLSYEVARRLGRPTGDPEERANLLVDDSNRLWDLLRTKECSRLAILTDNSGTELLMDLALADYLVCQDLVKEVQLHLKPHPFFVSDAMVQDVWAGLAALEAAGSATRELAQRLRTQIARGDLRLLIHWYYGTSLFYFQLPEDLRDLLADVDLVVAKGDVNYRRLLGDAHWLPTTPFAQATEYFPAPLVALRTMKAEIIVGLGPGVAERLRAEDPSWLVNGKRGVVQARL
jgi:Damage-control phosphatase ARMT1-like domain